MFTLIKQCLEPSKLTAVYMNEDKQKRARDLSVIILISILILLTALTLNAIRDKSDLPTNVVAFTGCLLSVVSWLLLKRGYLHASGLFIVFIGLVNVTAFSTVGQGICDLALFGFPIIFIFASLTLGRVIFRLSVGFALLVISWLALGVVNGWFVTQPFPDPTNRLNLLMMAEGGSISL